VNRCRGVVRLANFMANLQRLIDRSQR